MTIDERLEALAQSVELLRDTVHETSSKVTSLMGMMQTVLGATKALEGRA